MLKKLTLSLEKNVISKAKEIAQKNGTSISKLVSDYFMAWLTLQEINRADSRILPAISGIISKHKSRKQVIKGYKSHLARKYLRS